MNEIEILAKTYTDKCTVVRMVLTTTDTLDKFEPQTLYIDIPCALSMNQGSTSGATDTVQRIEYVSKLFARPDVDIIAGDEVTVDRLGEVRTFIAGEKVIHPSHIDVPLIRKDMA